MWKKIASLAALLSTSLTVQGCSPIIYKPIPTRSAKVPKIVKVPTPAGVKAPKATEPKNYIAPAWTQPTPPKKQNVYGTL